MSAASGGDKDTETKTEALPPKPLPFAEPAAVKSFSTTLDGLHGHLAKIDLPIQSALARRLGEAKLQEGPCSLTRPAVMGSRVLFGTDTANSERQFLMCSTIDQLQNDDPPILGVLPLPQDVRDVQWIYPELAVCTIGEGTLILVNVSLALELSLRGTLPVIHTATIRELAINQANRAQFASGGYDRNLCIVDVERPETLRSIKQEGIIGSVRWPLSNQNVCPSVTLDDGTFLIYDVRTAGAPAFRATMGKKELFAHERYTDHNVLLGFGDGEIQHIDVRVIDRVLHKQQDPFLDGIGGIEYRVQRNAFVISGMNDYTVWKHQPTGEARLWSRSRGGVNRMPRSSQVVTYAATFATDDIILCATSSGTLSVVTQGFTHRIKPA